MRVTSAHLRREGKIPVSTHLLKEVCRKSAKSSAFSLIILVGMSLSCEALDVFKDLISFKISSLSTRLKLNSKLLLYAFFILIMLGWFLYLTRILESEFPLPSSINSWSLYTGISRLVTILVKKVLNVSTILFSSVSISSSSTKVILFDFTDLSKRNGLTIFQNLLFDITEKVEVSNTVYKVGFDLDVNDAEIIP